jgi:hypothetical protein
MIRNPRQFDFDEDLLHDCAMKVVNIISGAISDLLPNSKIDLGTALLRKYKNNAFHVCDIEIFDKFKSNTKIVHIYLRSLHTYQTNKVLLGGSLNDERNTIVIMYRANAVGVKKLELIETAVPYLKTLIYHELVHSIDPYVETRSCKKLMNIRKSPEEDLAIYFNSKHELTAYSMDQCRQIKLVKKRMTKNDFESCVDAIRLIGIEHLTDRNRKKRLKELYLAWSSV